MATFANNRDRMHVLKGGASRPLPEADQEIANDAEAISLKDVSLGISKNAHLIALTKSTAIDIYKTNSKNPMIELWKRVSDKSVDERIIEPLYKLIIKRNPELEKFVSDSADKVIEKAEQNRGNTRMQNLAKFVKGIKLVEKLRGIAV